MNTVVYVIGTGPHGVIVSEIAERAGYTIGGFFDDNPTRAGQQVVGYPILGATHAIRPEMPILLGVGDNAGRGSLVARGVARGWTLIPLLQHPLTHISRHAVLHGLGTVIGAGVVVTVYTEIGAYCLLNNGSQVEHNTILEDGVHLSEGVKIASYCRVGAHTLVGVGACTRPRVTIGRECLIGAGSVVIDDIPDGAIAYGNPARVHGWTDAFRAQQAQEKRAQAG